MINYLWGGMFLISILIAFFQLIFNQNYEIFNQLNAAVFKNAQTAVDISISLIGILTFWSGILKLIEANGIADRIAKKIAPLFNVIMKDVPKNSPAISAMVLNMSANFLGLDNAATPVGLKAMTELQKYNKKKDEASDAQILFMMLNSSAITLIPITIFMYRSQMGAARPTDVFIPILLATSVSILTGFLLVAFKQHIQLTHPILLKWLGGLILLIFTLSCGFYFTSPENRMLFSSSFGNIILITLLGYIIFCSVRKKLNCYEIFVEGAKDGFGIAIQILPYLLAMLVAIGLFRACGILDFIADGIKYIFSLMHLNSDFADALPTAFMKPLSGSGARAMMIETMQTFGADSFPAFTASVIQGSTETTFYVLTVYFGAINIYKTRYALKYALCADLAGIIAAIVFSYMFYNN